MSDGDTDVIVVGTGASGVSVAFPLAERGLKVTMIDPDDGSLAPVLPNIDYLQSRRSSADQWRWMFGSDEANAETEEGATSPKFRAPTLSRVFANYGQTIGISTDAFTAVGSLASGGLTAAWGAGVSTFSDSDLAAFPISAEDLAPHYVEVARRIGLSGRSTDDLSAHFGLDELSDLPTPLSPLAEHIAVKYHARAASMRNMGFTMGRARLAVLNREHPHRQPCSSLGLCLWGCPRRSIYSASYDLSQLKRKGNVAHVSGLVIDDLTPLDHGGWQVRGTDRASGMPRLFRSRVVVLAAGVLSTTRLAMQVSGLRDLPIRLLSTPTAAFAMFFPTFFGQGQRHGTGLAQHWFVLQDSGEEVCGGLFPTGGLPVAEFALRAPLAKPMAVDLMRWVLPATTVGNIFYHSRHSANTIMLRQDGRLVVRGRLSPDFDVRHARIAKRIRAVFRKLGAVALPGSFAVGAPGSDVHYAGTLPMRHIPGALETDREGKLFGPTNLYIADASVLSDLPAKSHTLTVMANAARIGTGLAVKLNR